MATYQSVSSVAISDAGHCIIPKPSGLAVGDLMVAGVYANVNSTSVTITPPAGWTEQETVAGPASSPISRLSVFSKTAEAADVAASNFTFTVSNPGSTRTGGIMLRISSAGIVNAGESSVYDSLNAGSKSFTGFTPSRANCLLVFFGARGVDSSQPEFDITGVSIATSNPTWTERAEVDLDVTNQTHAMACYTATRPESTATGNITFSFTNPSVSCQTLGILIAISPRVNGSVTPTTKLNGYALTPIQSAVGDAIVDTPTLEAVNPTIWTPITKS
jgi:hypothetical protein